MLIALFSQQPADDQLALIERMHQDFEEANLTCFESGRFDATQLVYPFHSLVSHGSGASAPAAAHPRRQARAARPCLNDRL